MARHHELAMVSPNHFLAFACIALPLFWALDETLLSTGLANLCVAASATCDCAELLPGLADKNHLQQDFWIQCDDCNKWRELSASQFEQIQVSVLLVIVGLHSSTLGMSCISGMTGQSDDCSNICCIC